MMDRAAVQTMVFYRLAQWIRVCEKNVFCQDNVAPEFPFQSQHLLGCNPHCSTVAIQTPAPQTKTTVPPVARQVGPFTASKTFIKNAGVNISNNLQSPSLSTSAKNLEAKGFGRISLSKLCVGSHREGKKGKLQPDL